MANIGLIIPENGPQELWELAGRVNALHDYMANMRRQRGVLYDDDKRICSLLGFTDILTDAEKTETEASE